MPKLRLQLVAGVGCRFDHVNLLGGQTPVGSSPPMMALAMLPPPMKVM
jgi:hypothetical protein